jgi:hypothetical protein
MTEQRNDPNVPNPPTFPTHYQYQPPLPPKKKRHTVRTIAIVAGALIVVGAVAGALGSGGKKAATPTHSPTISAPSTTAAVIQPPILEPSDTAPAYVTPKKGDFTVTLKVLSKECFGTAGCNITYRAKLSQDLPTGALDPDVTYDLTYVVHGDDSGPQTETMYITGDQYEQPSEGFASTPSSGTKLTVTVTKIEAE